MLYDKIQQWGYDFGAKHALRFWDEGKHQQAGNDRKNLESGGCAKIKNETAR